MRKFLLKRALMLPLVALGVTFLLFSLTGLLPPEMRASIYLQDQRELTPELMRELIKEHKLDAPLVVRYGSWLGNLLKGDLGYSETARMKVTDAIKTYLSATLELTIFAIIPIFFIGTRLGTISAVKKDKWPDQLTRLLAITGYSLPTFVFGLLALMFFYGWLGVLGPGRYSFETDMLIHSDAFKSYTGLLTVDSLLNFKPAVFWDAVKHLILPASVLCFGSVAMLIRITRTSMLEELNKDYVRTARAKGLKESYVIANHVRRNAMIPVITLVSLQFVRLLGGVVITETVFDFPGIGRWGVKAAQQLDLAGVMGFSLMSALLFVMANTISDVLYAVMDPRIRYGE
ncbi:MAG: ABC transporter permease [Elusimicrobiales bacterium]|nr:ABC transporter permease [Elusimicrobiales bacterium]